MSIIDTLIGWARAKQIAELPPLHINEDGWLEGEGVVQIRSHPSWFYSRLSTPTGDPLAIVCHMSATNLGTGVNMAKNRVRPRRPRMPEHRDEDVDKKFDRAASWHASVEDGSIVQQASFEVGCWHAIGQIKGVGPANRTSVGIEWVGWEKDSRPEGQVLQGMRLWRALVQTYGIPRSLAMVPHAVIDPDRRSDPGKLFMVETASRVLDYAFAP